MHQNRQQTLFGIGYVATGDPARVLKEIDHEQKQKDEPLR
jgi:hypothetical protein